MSLDCMTAAIEKKFTSDRAVSALRLTPGETSQPPLSDEMVATVVPCMSETCLAEILVNEHSGMPLGCAQCMISLAKADAQGDLVLAGKYLHTNGRLSTYLKACLGQCAPPAPPGPSPNGLMF